MCLCHMKQTVWDREGWGRGGGGGGEGRVLDSTVDQTGLFCLNDFDECSSMSASTGAQLLLMSWLCAPPISWL